MKYSDNTLIMKSSELYKEIVKNGYVNRQVDLIYEDVGEIDEGLLRDMLELDRVEVFKFFFDSFWEDAFRKSTDSLIDGEIIYNIDYIIA